MENTLPIAVVDLAAPTSSTPKLSGSVEEQAIVQYINASGRLLEEVRHSESIIEVLIRYGFDDEELSIGMALQQAAKEAFGAADADAASDRGQTAAGELKAKITEAREEYDEFRLVARAVFPGLSDRINLRVMGDVPDDLQRFINLAHTAYTTAEQDVYADKLAKRGYPPERLESLHRFLDALAWLDAAHEAASEGSESEGTPAVGGESKSARHTPYDELRTFMKELKGVARAAFRKDPDTLARLGLAA